MRQILMLFAALILVLTVTAQTANGGSVPKLAYYEAANQFSFDSNPNGTWSYGYTTQVGGAFTPYTIRGQCPGDYNGWYGSTLCGTPMVVTQPAVPDRQLLTLHPGSNNEQSVVRWTVANSGTYNFYGYFFGLDASGGADVYLLKNKISAYHATVLGQGDNKSFNLALALRAGDKIDFVVATNAGDPVGGAYTGLAAAIAPQIFKFTTVEYPGAVDTIILAINNLGDIAGRYRDAEGIRHGFVRQRGVFKSIDYPGATATRMLNINDWGQVIGEAWDPSTGVLLATFVWKNDVFKTLMYPGADVTQALGINDLGYITGDYSVGDPNSNIGFVHSPDGSYFSFEAPGSTLHQTIPEGINLLGQVTGWYIDDAGLYHGFLRNPNGKFSTIDFPGAEAFGTMASRSNDWGTVEGLYFGGVAAGQSFLLMDSTFMPFWMPGQNFTEVHGINDLGQIAGIYYDMDWNFHGFTATPILPFKQ